MRRSVLMCACICSWSPDPPSVQILASGSYDDTIKLYLDDPSEDWFCLSTLTGHKSTVWALAWAPGGRYLASSSGDHTVRIWKRTEQHKWQCVTVLEEHERSVYSVTWGLGGQKEVQKGGEALGWVASTGGDGRINVWEFEVRATAMRVLMTDLCACDRSSQDPKT